ncbi:MAG: hypothetical protein AMXMBFR7_48170 [Planctomycetota bacterium]
MQQTNSVIAVPPRPVRRSVHADLLISYNLPPNIRVAAQACGIPYSTLVTRIARGKDLLAPVRKYGRSPEIFPNVQRFGGA